MILYSTNVKARHDLGINSITEALTKFEPWAPPPVPTVAIDVQTPLGLSIKTAPTGSMAQSFEFAARELMKNEPAETRLKYPELYQWKDAADSARGGANG